MKRLLFAAVLAAGFAATASAETYQIDPTHSQVMFTYSHLGFSNITARFDSLEGEVSYDPADVAASKVSATVSVDSLSSGVPDLDAHLKRDDLFDAAQFPAATFKSTSVAPAGEGKLRLTGDLTIHGVTRETTFDVTVNRVAEHPMRKAAAAGFDAVAHIKRSDFGIDKYVPNISDEVTIRITIEAIAKGEG